VILAGLVGGGLWFGWWYTQSKYYVGATENGTIAIFQGIPGRIAGFDLSTVAHVSDTNVDELTPVAQEKVKEGIGAQTFEEAEEQLAKLLDPSSRNVLPFCPTPTPVVTPSAQAGLPGVDPSASAVPTTAPPTSTAPVPTGPPDCRPADR
jgi:protein phosphatase